MLNVLKPSLLRVLMLFLLICLTATGCGSSSDSPSTGLDDQNDDLFVNNQFYGAYQIVWTIGDCEPETFSVIIGNDADQIGEDDYIYLGETGTSFSEDGVSISRLQNVITVAEESDGYALDLTLDFAEGLATATVTGTITEENGCSGSVTGTVTLITPTPAKINFEYLQYRQYVDHTKDHQSAWLELTQNGQPIAQENIVGARLYEVRDGVKNQVGSALSAETFSSDASYYGVYNLETFMVDIDESLQAYAGLSLKLEKVLFKGDYIFVVDLTENDMTYSVREKIYYPGDFSSPVDLNIVTQRNADNDLVISWEPISDDEETQNLRVNIIKTDNDGLWKNLLTVNMASDDLTNSVTIPAAMMATIETMAGGIERYGIQIQTRSYTESGLNYARGYSDILVDNTPFYGAYGVTVTTGEACEETVSITIGNDITRACIDDYVYLPEHALSSDIEQSPCGTIERKGKTLTLTSLDKTRVLTIDFDDTLGTASLSGANTHGMCTSEFTGTAKLINRDPMNVQFSYIKSKYKTEGFGGTVSCIALTENGSPIAQGDVQKIRIVNSRGEIEYMVENPAYQTQSTLIGTYNNTTSSIDDLLSVNWAGLLITDPSNFLPEDIYTIYVHTKDDYTVSSRVDFPGDEEINVLSGSSFKKIVSGENVEINLSWELPALPEGSDEYSFNELYVSIFKQNIDNESKEYLLTIKVNPNDGVTSLTLPDPMEEMVLDQEEKLIPGKELLLMELQTRNYTTLGMVNSSGYSSSFMQLMTVSPE